MGSAAMGTCYDRDAPMRSIYARLLGELPNVRVLHVASCPYVQHMQADKGAKS